MMIFFNDPIELENPAANAVRMALAMQARFGDLAEGWRRRGHELGLGIGVAQGYATLGEIGFEARRDYACIGAVTNLAARLCARAGPGQILAERRALSTIASLVQAQPLGALKLEGITHPIEVFAVGAWV
jgi:class 3 adenylate cyclase